MNGPLDPGDEGRYGSHPESASLVDIITRGSSDKWSIYGTVKIPLQEHLYTVPGDTYHSRLPINQSGSWRVI